MPYVGQDWRGPGNSWVRTSSGWHSTSVVAELNRHIKKYARERISVNNKPSSSKNSGGNGLSQKGSNYRNFIFVPSSWRSSKYTGTFLTPGDILCTFDLCSALRDQRKFQYVCRLLDIIIEKHFTSLSGSACNAFFSVCEETVNFAVNDQLFIKQILGILSRALEKMKANSEKFVGSTVMYNCRLRLLDSWVKEVGNIELVQREDDGKLNLLDLPVECQRKIFRCLTDPADVIHLSQTCKQFYRMGNHELLWEQLFWYHYTESQLPLVPMEEGKTDWRTGFSKLQKRHPLRQDYITMMARCCHCSFAYWQGSDHPCSYGTSQDGEKEQEIEYRDIQVELLSPTDLMSIVAAV